LWRRRSWRLGSVWVEVASVSIWLGLVGFWWFGAENDFCGFPLSGLAVAVGGEVGVGAVCVPCRTCGRWLRGPGVVGIVVGFAILTFGAPREHKMKNGVFQFCVRGCSISYPYQVGYYGGA
jgi:hypothetical protein